MGNSIGDRAIGLAAAVALAFCATGASASTVNLSGAPGNNTMAFSFEYTESNPTTPVQQNDYSLTVPGFYIFSNSLSPESSATPLGTSPVGAYGFQDSYRFVVTSATSGDALTASLGLGTLIAMSNLQLRLYELNSSTTITGSTPIPTVGAPPAGSTLVTPWTGTTGADSATTEITKSFSGLQAGTYVLDVAGLATGTLGGSYVGSLNLSPVPLPASCWLLLSVLGGFGIVARRRAAAA